MRKNDNTALWIIGAVAVAGYFAFRSGGFLNKSTVTTAPALPNYPAPQFSNPNDIGIATELPHAPDLGIYMPTVDLTGQSIQLF
jgi:hypothetical protein